MHDTNEAVAPFKVREMVFSQAVARLALFTPKRRPVFIFFVVCLLLHVHLNNSSKLAVNNAPITMLNSTTKRIRERRFGLYSYYDTVTNETDTNALIDFINTFNSQSTHLLYSYSILTSTYPHS